MKYLAHTAIALALTCLKCGDASAATEIWHLKNSVLTNGTAVTGSFAFDPVAGAYSDIRIHAGSTSFGIPDPVSPGNSIVLIAVDGPHSDYTGAPLVAMNWSSNLTAAGGTVGLNTAGFSFLGTCGSVTCGNVATAIGFASGSVTTAETWYLQNAVLTNGTAVTGSFDFDPVAGTYSDIQIHAGTTTFGIPDPVSPGNSIVLIAVDGPHSDFTGAPLVAMNWSSNLTSAGGTVGLNTAGFSFLGTCGSVSCGNVATAIGFASGSITTTSPVPDVSSWALLLVGLGFVGSSARRRQVRNQT
jgi:hypothetical protein